MTTALEAANFLLTLGPTDPEEQETSNLKLQKLLYYGQGLHLARYAAPLFSDEIQAWDHGPVCPDVYRCFKRYQANPLPPPKEFDPSTLPVAAREILQDVFSRFGQYSAARLRWMTHREPPWLNAYRPDVKGIVIPRRALADFFSCSLPPGQQGDILVDRESFEDIVERVTNPRPPTAFLRELLTRAE